MQRFKMKEKKSNRKIYFIVKLITPGEKQVKLSNYVYFIGLKRVTEREKMSSIALLEIAYTHFSCHMRENKQTKKISSKKVSIILTLI